MTDKTGGPAFPATDPHVYPTFPGLTIRQYYAAAALTGVLACPDLAWGPEETAEYCFMMADFMLAHEEQYR